MTAAERARERARFDSRFSAIRDWMSDRHISMPGPDETLEELDARFKDYVRQASVRETVKDYKTYMVVFWLAIEVAVIKIFKIPASGYTQFQLRKMSKYEVFLNEIGETQAVEGLGTTSPYQAILMASIKSAILFIVMKFLASWLERMNIGGGVANSLMPMIEGVIDGRRELPFDENGDPIPQAQGQGGQQGGGVDLMGMLGGLFGGGGGGGGGGGIDLASMLAQLGTTVTGGLQAAQTGAARGAPQAQRAPGPAPAPAPAPAPGPAPRRPFVPRYNEDDI